MVILQSLLLLTSSNYSYADGKDSWYWLGLAISLAFRIGLHRSLPHPPSEMSIGKEQGRFQRRIWWTCFVRDRLLALTEGKQTRIRKEDFEIEMIRVEDFYLGVGTGDGYKNRESLERDPLLRRIAEAFVRKAILCWNVSTHDIYTV